MKRLAAAKNPKEVVNDLGFLYGAKTRVPLEGQPAAAHPAVWGLWAAGLLLWTLAWCGSGLRPWVLSAGLTSCLVGSVIAAPPSTWAGWNRSAPGLAPPLASPAPTPTGRE